jgi:hypothetical protein
MFVGTATTLPELSRGPLMLLPLLLVCCLSDCAEADANADDDEDEDVAALAASELRDIDGEPEGDAGAFPAAAAAATIARRVKGWRTLEDDELSPLLLPLLPTGWNIKGGGGGGGGGIDCGGGCGRPASLERRLLSRILPLTALGSPLGSELGRPLIDESDRGLPPVLGDSAPSSSSSSSSSTCGLRGSDGCDDAGPPDADVPLLTRLLVRCCWYDAMEPAPSSSLPLSQTGLRATLLLFAGAVLPRPSPPPDTGDDEEEPLPETSGGKCPPLVVGVAVALLLLLPGDEGEEEDTRTRWYC